MTRPPQRGSFDVADTLGLLYWVGIIVVGCLYWFKYSTTSDTYFMRRLKTAYAAFFWPIFVIRLFLAQRNRQLSQASADEAKKRILGD